MKNKILAATLSCSLLLSVSAPALAIRTPSAGINGPISVCGTIQRNYVSSGSVSFQELGPLIEKNNLTVRMLREQLASAKAMDWSEAYNDLNDAIDELEDTRDTVKDSISQLYGASNGYKQAVQARDFAYQAAAGAILASAASLGQSDGEGSYQAAQKAIADALSGASAADRMVTSLPTEAALNDSLDTIEENLDTLEDSLQDIKKQEEAYNRTLQDTERQIENIIDQTTAGAESLYITILSTENKLAVMKDGAASTARLVQEMELRCKLGQISKLTLTQVQNGYDQLLRSIPAVESAIETMKASLQSLLGELPTGDLTLAGTPSVSETVLSTVNYTADLAIARENSFALYKAQRAVEDAKRDWEDARKDNGKNSYQATMAEHAYEAALLTQDSAVESFELGFRQLYTALAPAQATLATAKASLAYEEQTYAAAALKYKQGKLSKNALLDAEDTLTSAKRDVETAQLDLFSAWNSYRQGVDFGLVSSGG